MKISKADRMKLKRPLGRILSIAQVIKIARTKKIIAVGDVCGKALAEHEIKPWIWIYDGKELRKPVQWKIPKANAIAKNPRGNVTTSLMRAIDLAMRKKRETKIFVKGEEDLATLYCIAAAPKNTTIVYGQPSKGIVVADVERKRAFAKRILRMT